MLGGTDGECPPPHSAFEDPVTFEGDGYENLGGVGFTLVLRTQRLLPFDYPETQRPLSDRVIELRYGQGMTFNAIAEMLALEGWKGARGAALGANAIFSIYKKRQAHDSRRSAAVQSWIRRTIAYPPK